jgi:hypothetical protein
MFGWKDTLARKAQSVLLPHQRSLLTPPHRQEAAHLMVEPNSTAGARTGLFSLGMSRKSEFEDDERVTKRLRVGPATPAGFKMNPDNTNVTMEPTPAPVGRRAPARAAATSTSVARNMKTQGSRKPQVKVRRSGSQGCILRLNLFVLCSHLHLPLPLRSTPKSGTTHNPQSIQPTRDQTPNRPSPTRPLTMRTKVPPSCRSSLSKRRNR